MTFFDIALKNIKKSIRNYSIYIVSTTFAVMAFHVFNSIFYSREVSQLTATAQKYALAFKASSVMVAIFSAIFVGYSSAFFIKSRKKEIATYSLLGMGKRQIGLMIFSENMMLGIISIISGIGLGTLFSKFFLMALINLMKVDIKAGFVFNIKSVMITSVVFFIIFLAVSLYGYGVIYRFKIIELLRAQSSGERRPEASLVVVAVSTVFIIAGYIVSLQLKTPTDVFKYWWVILSLVVSGTYGLFYNLMVFLIKRASLNKTRYYSGTNMIVSTNVLYRVRSNARTLATIVVLSAATMTAMATTYLQYKILADTSREMAPYSYMYIDNDEAVNKKVETIIKNQSENQLKYEDDIELIKGKIEIAGSSDSIGCSIIGVSKFNEIMAHTGKKIKASLSSGSEAFFAQKLATGVDNKDSFLNRQAVLRRPSGDVRFKITGYKMTGVVNFNVSDNILVVSDDVYNRFNSEKAIRLKGYVVDRESRAKELTEMIKAAVPEKNMLSTNYEWFNEGYTVSGILFFIGLFVSILFLLVTGSIIYFKQLIEAYDDRQRFGTLKRIGVSDKEIKHTVKKQMRAVFGLPLIIAVCHSTAAFATLGNLMRDNVLACSIAVICLYAVLYGFYYLITVNSYTNIVNQV